jgi:predicted Zn-ribbon and HTH transcriptional regulator
VPEELQPVTKQRIGDLSALLLKHESTGLDEARAIICLDCHAIRDVSVRACACSSTHFWPLTRWSAKRKEHLMVTYACLTPGCDFEFTDNLTGAPLTRCPKCQGMEFISPPSAKATTQVGTMRAV